MTARYGDPRLPLTFWAKVRPADDSDCWLWTGALNSRGYGCFGVAGVSQLAHRLAYLTLVGPIEDDLTCDHVCMVKTCVRVDHLEIVTRAENSRRAAEHYRPTHCPNGHEYTEANTRLNRRTDRGTTPRACKTCEQDARRARYLAAHPDARKYRKPSPSAA